MRVCFITGEYPPMRGGVGDYTRELSLALEELGTEVCVITSRHAAVELDSRRTAGGPLVFHVIEDWSHRSWSKIGHVLAECQPEVVHIQYQTAAYGMHPAINVLPLYLRRLRRPPRIAVTFHDLKVPYLFPKAGPVRKLPAAILAWASDLVVVTNEEDALQVADTSSRSKPGTPAQLRSRLGGRHLRLIPIGSNIPVAPPAGYNRNEWRQRMGVGQDQILLAYFGFLGPSKGVDLLFDALRDLLNSRQGFKLAMVGGTSGDSDPTNRAYERQIRAIADESAFRGHVIWTGFTVPAEVSANLLASDICVLPFREGASLRHGTLVAAIVHGLAIVTTTPVQKAAPESARSCLPDNAFASLSTSVQLSHGQNAFLVPPNSASALRDGILELMANPGLAQEIRQGARKMAPLFAWDTIARQTLEAYNAIL